MEQETRLSSWRHCWSQWNLLQYCCSGSLGNEAQSEASTAFAAVAVTCAAVLLFVSSSNVPVLAQKTVLYCMPEPQGDEQGSHGVPAQLISLSLRRTSLRTSDTTNCSSSPLLVGCSSSTGVKIAGVVYSYFTTLRP